MKINYSNLEALMNDYFYAEEDYRSSSARYFREHGHGVNMDHAKTEEEKHIVYAYNEREKAYNAVWSVQSVLDMDRDQRDRMFSAIRAANKWYCKNQWLYCMKPSTEEKLVSYIFG